MKPHLETLKKLMQDKRAQLVDVREQNEWDAGHLKDAVLVTLSSLKEGKAASGLSSATPLYVHCRSGNRVNAAAPILESQGFVVVKIAEGFDELVREGFIRA